MNAATEILKQLTSEERRWANEARSLVCEMNALKVRLQIAESRREGAQDMIRSARALIKLDENDDGGE